MIESVHWLYRSAAWILKGILNVRLGEWLGFVGELIVAAVIYLELRSGRETEFLKAAFEKEQYKARDPLYRLFFSVPGKDWKEKSRGVREVLLKPENDELRTECAEQLWRLDMLGYVARPNILQRRIKRWRLGHTVSAFPHSIVFFYVMLRDHILSRRQQAGPWWAQHFLRYAMDCTDYIVRSGVPRIVLYDPDHERANDIEFTRSDLENLKTDIASLLKETPAGSKGNKRASRAHG